jgi:hypothetical protein
MEAAFEVLNQQSQSRETIKVEIEKVGKIQPGVTATLDFFSIES